MKVSKDWLVLLTILPIIADCGSNAGSDATSLQKPNTSGISLACAGCHASAPSLNPLVTNGSGTSGKHTKHVSDRGIECGKCHYNYMNQTTHMNGVLDTVNSTYFDVTNPAGQWINGTGSCASLDCHDTTLDWYGTIPWVLPACTVCHSSVKGIRRQVLGAGGDFDKESHHVINYSSRTTEIVTDADCLVCHDMSNHMSGAIRTKDKDTAGQVIVYNPLDPSSIEPFCLSCHDTDGAMTESVPLAPFSGPNTLGTGRNIAGAKIKESWEKQNGHRRKGLSCLGNAAAGTGCHGNYNSAAESGSINAHGSENRGILANKLTLPVPGGAPWDETRYKLCLDCHANYPSVLTIAQLAGVAEGSNYAQTFSGVGYTKFPYFVPDFIVTGFRDNFLNSLPLSDRNYNLHLLHLESALGSWYYRGGGGVFANGPLSCVGCHNVHGVDGLYDLWDEWQFSIQNDVSGIQYGKFGNANYSGITYPAYCVFTCHWDSNYRYIRTPFSEAKAIAQDTSGQGMGVQNGDTVTIYFSDSTSGPAIDATNIETVLALSNGHTWVDTDIDGLGTRGTISCVWSDADGKTNNVLTITFSIANSPAGDPSIAEGDFINFGSSSPITDTTTPPRRFRGKMTLKGNF